MYIYRERNPPIKCCNPVFLAVHFVLCNFLQFQVERERVQGGGEKKHEKENYQYPLISFQNLNTQK
jgi:hypothetical protein